MRAANWVCVVAKENRDGYVAAPCLYCGTTHRYHVLPPDKPTGVRARCGGGPLVLYTEGTYADAVQ